MSKIINPGRMIYNVRMAETHARRRKKKYLEEDGSKKIKPF